jgi:hypothetical protein
MTISAVVQYGTDSKGTLMSTSPASFLRSSSAVSREIGGEAVVIPICRGVGDMEAVYTFNSLGSELWKLLEHSCTEEELVIWVTANYEVTTEQARTDVMAFLDDLQQVGLVDKN